MADKTAYLDPRVKPEQTLGDYLNNKAYNPPVFLQAPQAVAGRKDDTGDSLARAIDYIASQPARLTAELRTQAGRKDDTGKLDVTLFFDDLPHAVEAVTEVLQWAVTKKQPTPYERGSWQHVTDFQRRYRGAMLRHTLNAAKTAKADRGTGFEHARDAETGLLELAHIATDAMFLLEKAIRAQKGFE